MKLTPKQRAAADALLQGNNILTAAQMVGVSRNTIARYFDNPDFKEVLRAGSDAAIMAAAARLSKTADDAISAIEEVLAAPDVDGARVKLRAADLALTHVVRIREQSDVLERLAALEELVGEGA